METESSTFSKTICSICYEDLKPIVEDLQSISICGHVFHELCLQQWFEYCTSAKKRSCPVCKQSCKGEDVARLYFQSIGDPNDSVLPQKLIDWEDEDPIMLRREVKRLDTKVLGLSSVLERQVKDLKELNEQLCLCKEKAKKEEALKNEALKQKASVQQLLTLKSEELNKSTLECMRLQERSLALAKELAAVKLASDPDLDEEEVVKLASLGNGENNKDTIDVLKKSLIVRNRSYKELIAKCNLHGRGEARSTKKLEKAKEKIQKLKARVQELETGLEAKENEILRALKASKKISSKTQDSINYNSNTIAAKDISSDHQGKQSSTPLPDLEPARALSSQKRDNLDSASNLNLNPSQVGVIIVDEESDDAALQRPSHLSETRDIRKETATHKTDTSIKITASKATVINNTCKTSPAIDENMSLLVEDLTQIEPVLNIRKESHSTLPLSKAGDVCFSGGLFGPDGTNRFLGKWCKRGQNNRSVAPQSSCSGDFISVGADGRGGKIKVLRSSDRSSMDDKENSFGTKRFKHGARTSQGSLQIEHFFGRVGQK